MSAEVFISMIWELLENVLVVVTPTSPLIFPRPLYHAGVIGLRLIILGGLFIFLAVVVVSHQISKLRVGGDIISSITLYKECFFK